MENTRKSTVGTMIGMAIAILIGAGISGIGAYVGINTLGMIMLLPFSPIIMMVLYGRCGWMPATAYAASLAVCAFFAVRPFWAIGYLAAFCLPGFAAMYLSYKGISFFQQIRFTMLIQALSLIIVLFALYVMHGSNLGGAAGEVFKNNIEMLSQEQIDTLADMFRNVYSQMGINIAGETSSEMISSVASIYEQSIKISVPLLMTLCILLNGTVGPLWGNYIRKRRGEDNVQYISLRGWRMPPMMTIGIAFGFVLTLIIHSTATPASEVIYMLSTFATTFAMTIQAMASVLSRLFRVGMSQGKRTVYAIVFLLLGGAFVPIYGAASALFGSQGVFMPLIRKRLEKSMKDKEDQDK